MLIVMMKVIKFPSQVSDERSELRSLGEVDEKEAISEMRSNQELKVE